ncbi:MAG: response regulator, partial [Bacteroidota bacterium]
KLESIFEEFTQADGSIQREYAGAGLGLSISRQLVQAHGGEMWAESELEQGSTFYFTLPISKQDATILTTYGQLTPLMPSVVSSEQRLVTEKERVRQYRILIVDDEPINHQVLKNHLGGEEFELESAMNGGEALTLIEQTQVPFDLILLDIMMPKMSGYEVAKRVREEFLPSELPIILVTAKNQVVDLVQGLETGANDYLAKPFSRDEFLARLKTHLNLKRINQATSRFLPREFIQSIGRVDITEAQPGDYQAKEVTVFFSDIRDYTSLSESMTPEENFGFVQAYARRMGPIILEHQGFVNQYLGDGIMALFQHSPDDALQAAIAMQESIRAYNQQRKAQGRHLLKVGMGMHTGSLILGIIGDERRSEASVIADTVNIAARLEGLTKYFGAQIVLSEDSYAQLTSPAQAQTRYLGLVQVKGRQQPMGIYECFAADDASAVAFKQTNRPTFHLALEAFMRGDMEEASDGFEPLAKGGDMAAQHFLTKA